MCFLTRNSSWFMETLALALHFPTVANSLFFFWSCSVAFRILVPKPGIEPMPWAVKLWRSNHWAIREVPANLPSVGCSCPLLSPSFQMGNFMQSSSLLFLKPDGV